MIEKKSLKYFYIFSKTFSLPIGIGTVAYLNFVFSAV